LSGNNRHVCVAIWSELKKLKAAENYPKFDSGNAVLFIPLLTIENAEIACRKYKLKLPKLATKYVT
jgi:hypothetical protein